MKIWVDTGHLTRLGSILNILRFCKHFSPRDLQHLVDRSKQLLAQLVLLCFFSTRQNFRSVMPSGAR